ncbi:MAG: HAD family phosphatase [Anaerolineae bacterium]|nr:HAD family phosphatase [Anaerolineae bacterium]
MKRTAILFDMDGLMVDTEPLSRASWDRVLAPHGVVIADDLYARMLGRRTTESVVMVLETHSLPWTAEDLIARKTAAFMALLREDIPAMPGLWVLLDELERRDIPWGVATSSPRLIAETVLRGLSLEDRCRTLVAGDQVERGKPAPDIYLLAAERMGVDPAACLALEDSEPGCLSAAAAGMRVAAVTAELPPGESFDCACRRYFTLAEVAADLDDLLA